MVFSNVIFDMNISCRSFVFSQSRVEVSAGLTNVSGLAVAAFDLVYCSLSQCPLAWLCPLRLSADVLKWLSVSMQRIYCKVVGQVR